jgi:hypothetical protein
VNSPPKTTDLAPRLARACDPCCGPTKGTLVENCLQNVFDLEWWMETQKHNLVSGRGRNVSLLVVAPQYTLVRLLFP